MGKLRGHAPLGSPLGAPSGHAGNHHHPRNRELCGHRRNCGNQPGAPPCPGLSGQRKIDAHDIPYSDAFGLRRHGIHRLQVREGLIVIGGIPLPERGERILEWGRIPRGSGRDFRQRDSAVFNRASDFIARMHPGAPRTARGIAVRALLAIMPHPFDPGLWYTPYQGQILTSVGAAIRTVRRYVSGKTGSSHEPMGDLGCGLPCCVWLSDSRRTGRAPVGRLPVSQPL